MLVGSEDASRANVSAVSKGYALARNTGAVEQNILCVNDDSLVEPKRRGILCDRAPGK